MDLTRNDYVCSEPVSTEFANGNPLSNQLTSRSRRTNAEADLIHAIAHLRRALIRYLENRLDISKSLPDAESGIFAAVLDYISARGREQLNSSFRDDLAPERLLTTAILSDLEERPPRSDTEENLEDQFFVDGLTTCALRFRQAYQALADVQRELQRPHS